MAKKMTEREAWLFLAKLWDKPGESPGSMPKIPTVLIGGNATWCLCTSVSLLNYAGLIQEGVQGSMYAKIRVLDDYDLIGFKWSRTLEGAKARAAFCRKMASQLDPKRKGVK